MQPRIPRQFASDQGVRRADQEVGLGAELAAVVAGARRRAVRDGDRQIDTAHLLHSLLESGSEVRAVMGPTPQVARLLGYLVQRSIGYGLRWQAVGEESAAGRGSGTDGADSWSPLAAAAMDHALRCADGPAGCTDLLAAIVGEPDSRAVEVLRRAGIEAADLLARIENRAGEYAADGRAPC
ncbi:Clp protease N-terminal domain-containing protein [Streptomyces sp. V3I7]|uniref:Clp protease N-terminal domain-containing protein n=1 Tax=Streptomyces sp. V3I7 TaxID=3042278 RepID=UPI00277FCA7E|nr:Clp protease N-terminal domain-containing protein [Streptomyces sp. V3I7]MDQ0989671.1 ATP-dependent Clp protease ATP-binding subunit ClpA [Streptomyces sp. V3I7]